METVNTDKVPTNESNAFKEVQSTLSTTYINKAFEDDSKKDESVAIEDSNNNQAKIETNKKKTIKLILSENNNKNNEKEIELNDLSGTSENKENQK